MEGGKGEGNNNIRYIETVGYWKSCKIGLPPQPLEEKWIKLTRPTPLN